TFTATVTALEGSVTLDGTVNFVFGDGNVQNGVACTPASGTSCTAQATHPYALGGSYSVTAAYQGNTNYEASTTAGPLSQTVNSCDVNPVVVSNADDGPGTLRQT